MPSMYLFENQDEAYKESVLPKGITRTLAIEMGSPFGWYKYANEVLAIDTFGASAPADKVIEEYGFTVENVVSIFKEMK